MSIQFIVADVLAQVSSTRGLIDDNWYWHWGAGVGLAALILAICFKNPKRGHDN